MFNCMAFCPFRSFYARQNVPAYFRFLHASPDTPAVDVYVNNNIFARNLGYRGFTRYFSMAPGVYNIRAYAAGTTTDPLINVNLNIVPGSISTLAFSGYRSDLSLETIDEPRQPILPYRTYIRFANLSPNTSSIDVGLSSGRRLFDDIGYREVGQYLDIAPGRYTLQLMNSDTGEVILTVPNTNLQPGRFYTVYGIGLTGAQPQLQVLIPLDGNSYLKAQ